MITSADHPSAQFNFWFFVKNIFFFEKFEKIFKIENFDKMSIFIIFLFFAAEGTNQEMRFTAKIFAKIKTANLNIFTAKFDKNFILRQLLVLITKFHLRNNFHYWTRFLNVRENLLPVKNWDRKWIFLTTVLNTRVLFRRMMEKKLKSRSISMSRNES